jgi:hypothetical protein
MTGGRADGTARHSDAAVQTIDRHLEQKIFFFNIKEITFVMIYPKQAHLQIQQNFQHEFLQFVEKI